MSEISGNMRRPIHRFSVTSFSVCTLSVALSHALTPLLTSRNLSVATKQWSYNAVENSDEDGRAVALEAARRCQVSPCFESSFAVMLGGEAEIGCNPMVPENCFHSSLCRRRVGLRSA